MLIMFAGMASRNSCIYGTDAKKNRDSSCYGATRYASTPFVTCGLGQNGTPLPPPKVESMIFTSNDETKNAKLSLGQHDILEKLSSVANMIVPDNPE